MEVVLVGYSQQQDQVYPYLCYMLLITIIIPGHSTYHILHNIAFRTQSPLLSSDDSEEELEPQMWRVERFHKERFLEERRDRLQVSYRV